MSLHPSVAAVRGGVRRALSDLDAGSPVIVACSGGPDSLALLAAAVFEAHKAGLSVIGATLDHGLQDGSAERADHVVSQMASLGADQTVSARLQVEAGGMGPEAAAREARYAVLGEIAARMDAAVTLLGHTRDDQAETVLLGLARGSGGRSIAGMRRAFPGHRHGYRRPLLDVSRADTVTACQVDGIQYWNDPHNVDPAYTRVRVRRRVLPVLEDELGPGVTAALARTADQLRDDMELLDEVARSELAALRDPSGGLPAAELARRHRAVRRRVLRLAAVAAGATDGELAHEHVMALDALVTDWRGQRWIDLPGPLRGVRRDGVVGFVTDPGATDSAPAAPSDDLPDSPSEGPG